MFKLEEVSYKDILYIDRLHIKANQITSILGESGAGKTTLLKLLNQLISPDHGTIYYNGKDLSQIPAVGHRREAVMLAQQPVIFEGTVMDNVMMGRVFSEKAQVSEIEARKAMNLVMLNKDPNGDADDLSGGEKQRLALARVLIMNAEVLLLDEPTSSLDKDTEEQVMKSFISEMKQRNKTVIMVTHSQMMAEKYSDEIIHLKKRGGAGSEREHD